LQKRRLTVYLAAMPLMTWPLIVSLLSTGAWLYLLLARDGFWRARPRIEDEPTVAPAAWPAVSVVVPARNEAAQVEMALTSLLNQTYAGPFRIVLVDDHSEDATRAIAQELAAGVAGRLEVVAARTLPPGWSGKVWAMAEGLARADAAWPEAGHVLFTDADILHDPANLGRLVAKSEGEGLDVVSLMVRLRCRSFWERLLIVPFVFFFQKLYPFTAVNDPSRREAAAAGGCMLVRREALAEAGGLERIRDRLIDDVALAQAIRRRPQAIGASIWLGHSSTTASLRPCSRLGDAWAMVTRTADTQLGHSLLLLLATTLGMALLYLVPPAAVLGWPWHGEAGVALFGGFAWLMMMVAYAPTTRLYRLPWPWLVTLPVAALFYVGMTLDSALRYRLGRGGLWKGRTSALAAGGAGHGVSNQQ
jgi:hopene-associated glycosyltransferase HpnB